MRLPFRSGEGQGLEVTVASYRLTARIAAGDLAETFEATRGETEPVVLKLFQTGTSDLRYAREISRTASAMKGLAEPGVLHVLDIGLCQGRMAVVRERVDGFNLGQVLSRLTAWGIMIPTPVALLIVLELLDTLQRAHRIGVVHGSITPGNILLSTRGQPALCDFGALQALWEVPEFKTRFAATGRGSYRAHELDRGEPATEQSDIFSLGAVAYQLLTLREVSPDKTGSTAPRSPFRVSSQLDQRLYPLLMRSMDTIPQLRYPACADFADALRGFLASSGVSATRDDLQKLLHDLFPEGWNVTPSGPFPFADSFELTPIESLDEQSHPSSPLESIGAKAPGSVPSRSEPAYDNMPAQTAVPKADDPIDPAPAAMRWSEPVEPAAEMPGQSPKRKLAFLVAAATAGIFAGGVMFWRPGRDAPAAPARGVSATVTTLPRSAPEPAKTLAAAPLQPTPSPAPAEGEAQRAKPDKAPAIEWDVPPRKGAGFLSVSSDVPAVVYIDGRRVKRHTPLKRYAVQPGARKILLVTLDGRDQRELTLKLGKGQLRRVDEVFNRPAARR